MHVWVGVGLAVGGVLGMGVDVGGGEGVGVVVDVPGCGC